MDSKTIESYILSRSEEALKENIMKNDVLKDHKMLRDMYMAGFADGIVAVSKMINDIQSVMKNKE